MGRTREIFYSYTTTTGARIGKSLVCVVLIAELTDSNVLKCSARGVSVCSPMDEPSSNDGYFMAKKYALRAIKNRESLRPITDRRAIRTILKTDCPFTHHLERNPRMTFYEIKKLFGNQGFNKKRPIITGGHLEIRDLPSLSTSKAAIQMADKLRISNEGW